MIDQTPWIPNLNEFLYLLDNGNEDFEINHEEENDCDADEDDDDAYNESSDWKFKDFII